MLQEAPRAHINLIRFLKDWLEKLDDAAGPLYVRLADGISRAAEMNVLTESSTLPGERDLAEALGLSRGTIRQTIQLLVDKGRLIRRHGASTILAKRFEKSLSNLIGFSEDIRARGMEPGSRWLSKGVFRPTIAETNALALPPGAIVTRFKRLRLADGQPIAIESSAVPSQYLPDPELVTESLYAVLRQRNCPPVRGRQRIRAGVMNAEEAELLETNPGAPILIIDRCCVTASGQPVEFTLTRYNGECYDFLTDLFT